MRQLQLNTSNKGITCCNIIISKRDWNLTVVNLIIQFGCPIRLDLSNDIAVIGQQLFVNICTTFI